VKTSLRTCLSTLAVALVASACAPGEPGQDAARSVSAQSPPPVAQQSTPGTGPTRGMLDPRSSDTADQVQAQLQIMQGALRDSLKAMLPMHRQRAETMIAGFHREMQGMNVTGGAAWNATVDSLRQDLARMPEMDAEELWSFFPQHGARLNRLAQMHRSTMADRKKK